MNSISSVQLQRIQQIIKFVVLLFGIIALSSCAHSTHTSKDTRLSTLLKNDPWVLQVVDYQQQLPSEHISQINTILNVDDEMRDEVIARFSHLPKQKAAKELATWLLAEDGLNLHYDITANLIPKQAYAQRRGNCLSFTLLLTALANELDINIEYNSVDIPQTWGMDDQLGMVFYRHVNGVLTTARTKQTFDLAMDVYYSGYPQRFISRDQALALLLNNKALDLLRSDQLQRAEHSLKFAISLSPKNPDLWVNLGVIMKQKDKLDLAEISFLYAYELDQYNIPAASNLERLYNQLGMLDKAKKFKKQSDRAHKKNPYYHYQIALDEYSEDRYGNALKATNQAIKLHDLDPRFYELKSLISERQHKYNSALKSMKKAYAISEGAEQRDKYADKAVQVSQRAKENISRRWKNKSRGSAYR